MAQFNDPAILPDRIALWREAGREYGSGDPINN